MASPDHPARKPALYPWLLIAFAVAIAWRAWFIANLPMVSRDGVDYIDYAQRLDTNGIVAIRDHDFEQHPLFPGAIAIAHKVLSAVAGGDGPMVWQRSGQLVALLCGGVVLLLIATLTRRIVSTLELPLCADRTAAIAVLLAGLLPLNVWLSADVMSEQLFLVFYLGACVALCRIGARAGLCAGVLAGLAFLTRPEAVALLVGAGAVALYGWMSGRRAKAATMFALAIAGFLMIAGPYWNVLGGFSPKADKRTVDELVVERTSSFAYARLRTSEVSLAVAPWFALLETARAGRLIVIGLAIPVVFALRTQIVRSPLFAPAAIAMAHFAMITLLRYRHGYLSPRHALVIVELLIPLAAIALAYATTWKLRWFGPLAIVAASMPLAIYATRFPDDQNRHLLPAAEWIRARSGDGLTSLLGPRSHSRVAFYSTARFVLWHDDGATIDERFAALREAAIREQVRLISLELGPPGRETHERAGNAELFDRLLPDGIEGASVEVVYDQPTRDGARMVILTLRWN